MNIPTESEVQNGVAGFYVMATGMVAIAIGVAYGLWYFATQIPL